MVCAVFKTVPVCFSRMKMSYIPFRESKLTRLFQGMFCGRGRASMIVNINQCASTYDETLHVMKFSAVARQVCEGWWGFFCVCTVTFCNMLNNKVINER